MELAGVIAHGGDHRLHTKSRAVLPQQSAFCLRPSHSLGAFEKHRHATRRVGEAGKWSSDDLADVEPRQANRYVVPSRYSSEIVEQDERIARVFRPRARGSRRRLVRWFARDGHHQGVTVATGRQWARG